MDPRFRLPAGRQARMTKATMKNQFKKYYEAINFTESLSNIAQPDYMAGVKHFDKWLERFGFFLEKLGNPHLRMRYIHVAGSSGKGSVASMIQSVLVVAGHKTGLFVSPHTTTTIERIKINDLFIGPDEFAQLVEKIKPVISDMLENSDWGLPSHYEILTAIAFLYFAEQKCEYAVLEVGCGGRYDATNIIPAPLITIINLIDYDHEEILGHTLTAIAKEKAAIIKPGTAFFTTARNKKHVLEIFKKECQKNNVSYNAIKPSDKYYNLQLLGAHQQANANLVAAACRHLNIPEKIISKGLEQTKLPCRFEIIQKNPLVIIDGAHNGSKFTTTLSALANLTYNRLYIIIALSRNKKAATLFKEIAAKADSIYITRHQNTYRKCVSLRDIKKEIAKYTNNKAKVFIDPRQALDEALAKAKTNDAILVTGSLFLAGELRKRWVPEEEILRKRKA
jgi:dihydrofolate synthase / folylpolyglutamate synthase